MQWFDASDQAAIDRIDAAWSDAPIDNEEVLSMILDVAREQVTTYAEDGAPAEQVSALLESLGHADKIDAVLAILGEAPTEPPTRYVLAQLQQAKNLFNAGRVVADSGPDGYSFVARPLDKEIRAIIRPRSGVASVC